MKQHLKWAQNQIRLKANSLRKEINGASAKEDFKANLEELKDKCSFLYGKEERHAFQKMDDFDFT